MQAQRNFAENAPPKTATTDDLSGNAIPGRSYIRRVGGSPSIILMLAGDAYASALFRARKANLDGPGSAAVAQQTSTSVTN
jgi:hypothetical protein